MSVLYELDRGSPASCKPEHRSNPAPHNPEYRTGPVLRELVRRELARRHYGNYLGYIHTALGVGWKDTAMSAFLAREIENFIETETGHAFDILVVNCPPQHGKSMTITESLPSWYMGRHRNANVIIASYDSDFAERFCRKNKEKLRCAGRQLFGVGIGSIDRSSEFELSGGRGRLIARGIMSGITGNPANLVIIDDPVKNRQEADSPTYRSRMWSEWQASIKSRLAAGAKVIVIMTPWREDVFDAELLRRENNVRHIRLPVEAEENDPMGRIPGSALCPELGKDEAWLADFKTGYISDPQGGQRSWSAMYQCSPRTEGGNLVQREWWRYYDPEDMRQTGFASEIISVDASFKDRPDSDFVSIQVWGKIRKDFYLLYCLNRRLDFPKTVEAVRTVQKLYPEAMPVLIEDAANGEAVIKTLQTEMLIRPVTPLGGKVSRVNAVSPAIESGHVFLPLPEKFAWVDDFVEQWTAFPDGKNDDMVDAASQALFSMLFRSGDLYPEADDPCSRVDEERAFEEFMLYSAGKAYGGRGKQG